MPEVPDREDGAPDTMLRVGAPDRPERVGAPDTALRAGAPEREDGACGGFPPPVVVDSCQALAAPPLSVNV